MGRKKILLVDDSSTVLLMEKMILSKSRYQLVTACDGQEGLDKAVAERPDLILLDVVMPRMDGFEVCRRIRATDDVPVLFLSARDTELDKVVGLELGGDDYLAKPFGIRELQARVKALLRRSTASKPAAPATEGERFEAGGIVLDEATHEVTHGGEPIDLTPREFELLACLMRQDHHRL